MLTSRELNNPTDDFEWKYVEVLLKMFPLISHWVHNGLLEPEEFHCSEVRHGF